MSRASMSFVIVVLLSFLSSSFAGDVVRWTDESGMIHFSDSLDNVPAKYRGQAKLEKFKEEKLPERSHSEGTRAGPDSRILQSMLESWGEKPKLNSYEVPFEAYEGTAQRVIVSVTFNDSVTVPMAIDTGAPGLIISPQLAKKLGLFGNDEGMVLTATGGIGGNVPAIRTFLDKVQVGGAKDSFIPATITPSISRSFEGLIGMVFMSRYSFKVDPVKQVVVFEEIAPDPNLPGGRNERWWKGQFKELQALRAAWNSFVSQGKGNYQQREFAGRQVKEADKLLSKLDRYASEYSVPQNWR
jgi:predicted aspartyl protease